MVRKGTGGTVLEEIINNVWTDHWRRKTVPIRLNWVSDPIINNNMSVSIVSIFSEDNGAINNIDINTTDVAGGELHVGYLDIPHNDIDTTYGILGPIENNLESPYNWEPDN